MKYYSTKDYVVLFSLIAVGALLGLLMGAVGWGLVLSLVAWVFYQHVEYVNFRKWAESPLQRPEARSDAWQSGMDTLYRALQRSRDRTHRALKRLREMRAVNTALPDAAVLVDDDGRIDSFNPASRALLKLRNSDIDNNLGSLVRHPDFIALLKGQVAGDVIEVVSPFNDQVRLEVRSIPVGEAHRLVLARDITQLNRLLTMRQDFVANVSHELRTPLTVVIGYLESLLEENLDGATTRELLLKLRSPTRRMEALVNDLLLLTRLESSPSLAIQELDGIEMGALLKGVLREAEGLSGGQHELVLQLRSGVRVLGKEQELHSAVSNLVSNAIRYSPEGGRILVSWDDDGDGAILAVEDQGIGIPREHLSRLTERFYRVDLARARIQGGTGLGLAIVKHVLKRHNTNLEIESALGVGSRFYCRFPAAQLDRSVQPTQQDAL